MSASAHEKVETNLGLMIVLTLLLASVGGLAQLVPLYFQKHTTQPVAGVKPYSALQLEGRDVYIREGCYNCHSQMIRPFRWETERYGHYSVAGEFVYDRPFQWGSKRTGPDLQRVGGRYSDEWHRAHLINPRDVVPESNMPGYPYLLKAELNGAGVQDKMRALNKVVGFTCTGCETYSDKDIADAPATLKGKTEMDAVIAYLQGLGTAVKMSQ